MADISTKVKKLNIFQQIRLNYHRSRARNNKETIEEMDKLPDYIRKDDMVISSLVFSDRFSNEELKKLDYKEVCKWKHDYEFIKSYSTEERFNLLKEGIISPYLFTEEQRTELLLDLIHEGKPNALQDINWGYMPEIDENIKAILDNNNEKELSDSLLQYFDSSLLSHMIKDNPSIIAKLNDAQQTKYSEELRQYIEKYKKDNYHLTEYASTRMECLQYLDRDKKIEISKYMIDYHQKYEVVKYLQEDERKSILKELYNSEDRSLGMQTISNIVPYISGKELSIFNNENKLLPNERRMVIDSITDEKELANFFSRSRSCIGEYEESKNLAELLTKYKKFDCMFDLSEENRAVMEPEFIKLSIDEKKSYISLNMRYTKYLPPKEQAEIVEKNLEMIKYCSIEGKKFFIKSNPRKFLEIDQRSMKELAAEDTRLYELLPYPIKFDITNNLDIKENSRLIVALLKQNIRNSKLIKLEKDSKSSIPELMDLFSGIENESDEKIKDYFLHSKFTSAIGKLSTAKDILHGKNAGEEIIGLDSYHSTQIEAIQKLNPNQIKQLANIDVNYVLPYLTGKNINSLEGAETELSKKRAKELFVTMYGNEMYDEYQECIETIYDLQEKNNDEVKKMSYSSENMVGDFENFKNHTEIPLEEFKILFNSQILHKCKPEQIKEYFRNLKEGKGTQEEFLDIIQTAYGDKAADIIKSRPQLNVHSINSLEVFDSKIIESYGEAFVHDSISYNLRDFSEFLEAQKNPETAEVFKSYYDILSGILGENVETMQKAISEFSYCKDLLLSVKDKELTNIQVLNLLNVLSSEKNCFNIETLEQLDRYNEIANRELQEITDNTDKIVFKGDTYKQDDFILANMKERVCRNLLGMRYHDNTELSYGDSLVTLNTLYDFSSDESSKTNYTDTEKRFMDIINYIYSEKDKSKFTEFIKNVQSNTQMRNIPAFRSVITKVQERELSELNSHITTIDTLDKVCEQEKNNADPSIYKEEIDGVSVYHLNGYQYCMFSHDSGTMSYEDIASYEGQGGNSAICSRVITGNLGDIKNKFLYGKIPNRGIITMYNNDANTQHMSKRTKMYGNQGVSVKEIDKINNAGNETAIYRRNREHSEISNENGGGKILPMAYGILSSDDISGYAKKFKGTGVALFVRHSEKYKEKENITQSVEKDNQDER